jgi:hypothetical protein
MTSQRCVKETCEDERGNGQEMAPSTRSSRTIVGDGNQVVGIECFRESRTGS